MPVEVKFRGVVLFNVQDQDLVDVRLAQAEDAGRSGALASHLDGSPARRHFARMLVMNEHNDVVLRTNITGKRIVISDAVQTGPCITMPDVFSLPALASMVNADTTSQSDLELIPESDPTFWHNAASLIRLSGGNLIAGITRPVTWKIPTLPRARRNDRVERIPESIVWRSFSSAATLRIEDPASGRLEHELLLGPTLPRVAVCNFDMEWPSPTEIDGVFELQSRGDKFVDDDFKWVYRLLRCRDRTTLDALLHPEGTELPAPFLDPAPVLVPGKNPLTGMCFSSIWSS